MSSVLYLLGQLPPAPDPGWTEWAEKFGIPALFALMLLGLFYVLFYMKDKNAERRLDEGTAQNQALTDKLLGVIETSTKAIGTMTTELQESRRDTFHSLERVQKAVQEVETELRDVRNSLDGLTEEVRRGKDGGSTGANFEVRG